MGFFEVNKLQLQVMANNGFDVDSGSNIKETTLLYDDQELNAPTFFFNNGYNGIEFEVSIVMREDYFYKGRAYMDYLNQWDKWNTVVSVVVDGATVVTLLPPLAAVYQPANAYASLVTVVGAVNVDAVF